MSHLLTFRKGWQNERLAAYLLSRFSFVAQPGSVADDLGSDFFCTIFEIVDVLGRDALLPRSSFAIQVKSSASEVSADNKIDYLHSLELPFFLGVVRQSPPTMSIYSAEFLPLLFSQYGKPSKLTLLPVVDPDFSANRWYEEVGVKAIRLLCPHVSTLSADDAPETFAATVGTLLHICSRAHANIASRVSEEHIYDVDGKGTYHMMAGSGSAKVFRLNFLKRLGEVFSNLEWILGACPDNFPIEEFQVFESLYQRLGTIYGRMPPYVSGPYGNLKARLAIEQS